MCPWGRGPDAYQRPPPPKIPGRHVLSFLEHGIAPEHREFVDALLDKLSVDRYQYRMNHPIPDEAGGEPFSLERRLSFIGTYKFMIVAEEVVERDWVGPELSHALAAGTVPIYIGAPNAHDYEPGEQAIIMASDFPSVDALVQHIRTALQDESVYREHLAWKQRPLRPRFQERLDACVHYAECRLCEAVNARITWK